MATVSDPRNAAPAAPAPAAAATGASWTPANPAPLGLAGFGVTTFVLSMVNSNLVGAQATTAVLGLALAFGGIAQLLAGMWEFRAGNAFGALVHSSFGAFWISYYILVQQSLPGLTKVGGAASGIGLYLWAWAIFTVLLTLCSFNLPRIIPAILAALVVTFVFLAIGASGTDSSMTHIGGYAGIVTAALALYAAAGLLMKETYGRWVLPIGALE